MWLKISGTLEPNKKYAVLTMEEHDSLRKQLADAKEEIVRLKFVPVLTRTVLNKQLAAAESIILKHRDEIADLNKQLAEAQKLVRELQKRVNDERDYMICGKCNRKYLHIIPPDCPFCHEKSLKGA